MKSRHRKPKMGRRKYVPKPKPETVVVNKFDPSQRRDEQGRWTTTRHSPAAGFSGYASHPYRDAEARVAAARLKVTAAYNAEHDPSVPASLALRRSAEAYEELNASRVALSKEARLDLVAYLGRDGNGTGKFIRSSSRGDTKWTDEEHDRRREAMDFSRDVLSGRTSGPVPDVAFGRPERNRADYYYGTVRVTRADDAGTYVHEIGHHLEEHVPGAREKAMEFLSRRCKDEPDTLLAFKFPSHGYDLYETGRRDDFAKLFPDNEASAYYVGKTYPGGKHTEVISMGLELMFRDARRFAVTDPDYFDLMVGILRG